MQTLVLALNCSATCALPFHAQLSLVLPWSDTQDSQRAPAAVFDGSDSTNVLVAVAGLTSTSWEVAGFAVTTGPASTQVDAARAWTTQLPLGGSIPTAVAAAGGLAVLELDGRVMALQPRDGGLAWNASSPCTLGRPRFVSARWGLGGAMAERAPPGVGAVRHAARAALYTTCALCATPRPGTHRSAKACAPSPCPHHAGLHRMPSTSSARSCLVTPR